MFGIKESYSNPPPKHIQLAISLASSYHSPFFEILIVEVKHTNKNIIFNETC